MFFENLYKKLKNIGTFSRNHRPTKPKIVFQFLFRFLLNFSV